MKNQNCEKYAYLDQLSTRRLEELLLADFEDDSGRDSSEVVFHILEVLQKREDGLAAEPADTDQAWERFLQYYNIPEGEDQALYPCKADAEEPEAHQEKVVPPAKKSAARFRFPRRGFGIVAATVAMLFALMVGVQASGMDIFGALAQWTNETFHFGLGNGYSEHYEMFLDELGKNDIPKNLAPNRFPSGFEAAEPEVWNDLSGTSIQIPFHDDTGKNFTITIERYNSMEDINLWTFEKDSTFIEEYTVGPNTFHIFSNLDMVTATWYDGYLVERIWGNFSIDDVKLIIDSIEGL